MQDGNEHPAGETIRSVACVDQNLNTSSFMGFNNAIQQRNRMNESCQCVGGHTESDPGGHNGGPTCP